MNVDTIKNSDYFLKRPETVLMNSQNNCKLKVLRIILWKILPSDYKYEF